MSEAPGPDAGAVRLQLEQILASTSFSGSKRLSRFLRFIVASVLEGRGDEIKERAIGVEVFDRGNEFNPSTDNIVRVEAARLRHKLREYYDGPGKADAIWIEVPKGAYAPVFRVTEAAATASKRSHRLPAYRVAAVGAALLAGLVFAGGRVNLTRPEQPDATAAALYRKGRELWNQRTLDGLKESVHVYRQAIGRQPGYADAWIGLADSYAVLAGNDYPDSGAYVADGIAAARRALALSPRAGRPHAALATFYRYALQFANAEHENRLAIALSPGDAVGHQWYGHFLMCQRRYREALDQLEQARQIDPSQPMIGVNIGEVYFWLGDQDQALNWYQKTLDLHPSCVAAALGVQSVQIARHQYSAALQDVNRRLAMFPDDPGLRAHRQICLEALGLTGSKEISSGASGFRGHADSYALTRPRVWPDPPYKVIGPQ